jgi:hypothetical protein
VRKIFYNPKVPAEVRELLEYYDGISRELGDRFWSELSTALNYTKRHPTRHHFDSLGVGLRRVNLTDFPIHFLFRVFPDHIRVTVVRHDHRRPSFGIRRQ